MPVGLLIVMILILSSGIFIIINSSKPQRLRSAKSYNFYTKVYRFLSSFFLSQQSILKIYNRLAILSIHNKYDMMVLATKYYLMSTAISMGVIVASIVLYRDAIFMLIGILFSLLLRNVLIEKQLDKTQLKVYKALKKAISDIRKEYMRVGSVTEAISNVQYDPIIQKPMNEILNILTTSNGELKLQEFYESTPFRHIQTLAGVCYNINNSGDTIDGHGNSNFIQALTLIAGDINFELERLMKQKTKFGYIEYLPFLPIFAIPILEGYFISIMPGTALIYKAPMGYLCKTIELISCIISYLIVSRINSNIAFKEDDRSLWALKLLENKFVNKIITNIIPKGRKADKKERLLKRVLSRMTLKELYLKKVAYSFTAFIVSIVVILIAVSLGESYIRTSTQQLSLVATTEMDEYTKDAIREMDTIYLESDQEWSEEQLKSLVKSYMPRLTDLQVLDQIKRLQDKKKSLKNAYFKWWYMWISFAVGILGWFIPNIMLKLRKYIVETEAEEDFLQLQTLTSILMNTDIDTLDTIYQLGTHSRIHKDMLLYCYHSYPADPERELARLKNKTPILEFKRFIDNLQLTINDLSLREAFSDLIIDREHTKKMREMSVETALNRRRGLCGPLSLLPIGLFVIGELLIPLGVLGFNEFMNALGSLG